LLICECPATKQPAPTREVILFFDTETTGKLDYKGDFATPTQPDLVQLAALLYDVASDTVWASINTVVHPHASADESKVKLFTISDEVAEIHKVRHSDAMMFGQPRRTVLSVFNFMCKAATTLAAHNLSFDELLMRVAYHREGAPHRIDGLKKVCTMLAAAPVLKLPKVGKGGAPWRGKLTPGDEYKWPTLMECYEFFFGKKFDGAHNAMNDVMAMVAVWKELRKLGAV
jgi:DNA polymerase III epsilon subunit-like protein